MATDADSPFVLDVSALRRRRVDHHRVQLELTTAWIDQVLRDADGRALQPASVQLQLHLQPSGVVVLTGPLRLALEVPCGRCLAPAAVDASEEIIATFVPEERLASMTTQVDPGDPDGLGLAADDLDVWAYDGKRIDLRELLREQISLGIPMRALCARGEACRGLCTHCGADLNEQPAANPAGDMLQHCAVCGGALTDEALADDEDAPQSALARALQKIDLS